MAEVWRAEAGGLYYEVHGEADAPPLILSSGLGGLASYWGPNIPALAEHFRVIAYDHRGTGRSRRSLPDFMTVDDLANDMRALLDGLGIERAHVIGHAAGGIAALALARIAAERVARVVVVNSWVSADPHFLRCFEARLALLRLAGPEAYLRAQPIFLFPARWSSEHDAELNADLAHQLAAFPGAAVTEKRIAALAAFDARRWIGALDAEILALSARDDMLVPWTCSDALAEASPRIASAHVDWGGHACNVTDPETFNRLVLDFLRS